MTRFNAQTQKVHPRKTTNFHDEVAYDMGDPLLKLFVAASTGTLNARFYEKEDADFSKNRGRGRGRTRVGYSSYYHFEPTRGQGPSPDKEDEKRAMVYRVKELENLVAQVKPWEAANVAKMIRDEMYMRTTPVVILGILAKQGRLERQFVPHVLRRADEPLELAAVWQFLSGRTDLKKMPNALKKGLSDAEVKLVDAYTARKYYGKNITQLDLMRLTHPAAKNDEQNQVFKMIKEGTLPLIGTWETRLSAAGPDPVAKRAAWEGWVDEDMTYMAALRNLRNLIEADVSPKHFAKVCDLLGNQEAASKAMQFPFRFFTAYRMLLEGDRKRIPPIPPIYHGQPIDLKRLVGALELGVRASASGIPGWGYLQDKRVLIASDTSGSMQSPVSSGSVVELYHIALVLGFVMQANLPYVTVGMFGDRWEALPATPNILAGTTDAYRLEGRVGYATHGDKVFEWARQKGTHYDVFAFFSDMQIYGDMNAIRNRGRSAFETAFDAYKREVNPNAKLLLFCLNGYSTTPIDIVRPDVYLISGWSERVFQVIEALESGKDPLAKLRLPVG